MNRNTQYNSITPVHVQRGPGAHVLGVAIVGALQLMGCPQPSPGLSPQISESDLMIIRLEIDASASLPAGVEGLVGDVSRVEIHTAGGWTQHEVQAHVEAPAGQTSLVVRLVSEAAEVQMVRVHGDFKLVTAEGLEPLSQKSNRGLQIHLRDQKLEPGAINHVRVSLADALAQPGPKGWELRPTVSATVSAQDLDLATTVVTPEGGGKLELDDGYEVIIPPGAADSNFVAYVERVSEGDGAYYLVGPEGTTFNLPVTVKFPSDALEPAITWDGKILWGVHDGVGRIVVENNHFSCHDDVPDEVETKVTDGVFLFEAHLCGADYSILIADLDDSRIAVRPLLGPKLDGLGKSEECLGKPVFRTKSVEALMTPSTWNPPSTWDPPMSWHRPVAALSADHFSSNDPFELGGCCRHLTVVEHDEIHKFVKGAALGFENLASGGTQAEVKIGVPIDMQHVISSQTRYVKDGQIGYSEENKNEFQYLRGQDARTAIGFSKDRRFLVLGSADNALTGDEWVEVLLRSRTVSLTGGDETVKVHEAFRQDEGGTPDLVYEKDGELISSSGSLTFPDPTINAFGVFWQKDPPKPDPGCENPDAPAYLDVKPWNWFYDPVVTLLCHGVVDNGEYYRPGDDANRAEFLKILLESAFPGKGSWTLQDADFNHFADVKPGAWYAPYVEFGYLHGIVEGYFENDAWWFKPGDMVNRAEAAKMAVSIGGAPGAAKPFQKIYDFYDDLKKNGQSAGDDFSDVPFGEWYYYPVYALYLFDGDADDNRDGIICGQGKTGEYQPTGTLNRAEMAKIACLAAGFCPPKPC